MHYNNIQQFISGTTSIHTVLNHVRHNALLPQILHGYPFTLSRNRTYFYPFRVINVTKKGQKYVLLLDRLSGLRRSRVHSLMIARRSLCPEKLGSIPGQGSKGINFLGWHGPDMSITVTKRR